MEPVFSGYSYLYNRGVRFANSVGTPVIFQANDLFPGSLQDDPAYHLTGLPLTPCHALNIVQQQDDAEDSAFWAERDLVPTSKGSRLPVLLTQGFLETNTKPDRAFDYWSALRGRANIGWFGQFDHVRGWETDASGRSQTGRDPQAFVAQVEAFLAKHLKGERGRSVRAARPGVQVQDNLGRWRRERAWPPADVRMRRTTLRTGSYADDGSNTATGSDAATARSCSCAVGAGSGAPSAHAAYPPADSAPRAITSTIASRMRPSTLRVRPRSAAVSADTVSDPAIRSAKSDSASVESRCVVIPPPSVVRHSPSHHARPPPEPHAGVRIASIRLPPDVVTPPDGDTRRQVKAPRRVKAPRQVTKRRRSSRVTRSQRSTTYREAWSTQPTGERSSRSSATRRRMRSRRSTGSEGSRF